MGKVRNSWALVKQSFAILRSDKQLMMLPVLSAISCLLVSTVILGGGLALLPLVKSWQVADPNWRPSTTLIFVAMFIFYVANYSVIVFFNTALVGAADIRMSGGIPTLKEGLHLAWQRKGVIFQWAVLSATVGVILKLIEQRAKFIGQIVASLLGLAWALASYFVIPVLAFEDLGPIDALKRSAEIFRRNWGEKVVAGFSFGLIFFLLALPGFLLPFAGGVLAGDTGLIVGVVLMVLYFILLAIVSAATQGIFIAAVYRYAKTGQPSAGFRPENFSMAWSPK